MTSNFEILSLISPIILTIILFSLGMRYQEYKTKKNHTREKAKSINSNTIPILNQKIDELNEYLDEKTYIKYDKLQKTPIQKLNPNHFIDVVKSYNIFKIESGKIILTYTKDKYLRRHMKIILSRLNDYHTSAGKLEKLIESLTSSKPPKSFILTLEDICINEIGENAKNLKDDDFFALYYLSLTGSKNAYKSGSRFVIDLLNKRFDDLQSAADNNSDLKSTFNIIKTEIELIKVSLTGASDEIQKLREIWQNELRI